MRQSVFLVTTILLLYWMLTSLGMEKRPSPLQKGKSAIVQHRPVRLRMMNSHYWGPNAQKCLKTCYSLDFPDLKLSCTLEYVQRDEAVDGDGDGDG